jgi:hypothetical protein
MPAQVHVPVRTEGLTAIASGYEPVVDYGTGEVRTDRVSGQPNYRVHLTVVLPGEVRPQVWSVTVPGEPKSLLVGQVVTITDLVATEWEIEGRHGIGFRAASIAPVSGSQRSSGNSGRETASG